MFHYKYLVALLVAAVGWLVLLELKKRGRLNLESHLVLLIFKTERGKGFISKVAQHRKFWKVFSTLGVVIGVLGMAAVLFFIGNSLYGKYIVGMPTEGEFMLVIPGITIPFWYGILGLLTVLVSHEFAHGIVARSENISLKSLGVASITIVPIGAFVEPDEEELKRSSRATKLRVYAAGSFANILLAIIAVSIIFSFTGFFLDSSKVQVANVVEGSPADGILQTGDIIKAVNGVEASSADEFVETAKNLGPNRKITVETDRGSFSLITASRKSDPSKGYIGVVPQTPVIPGLPEYIYFSLWWIFLLNQGIGLINLAPLHFGVAATDGHQMLREALSKLLGEQGAEKLSFFVSTSTLLGIILVVFDPSGLR